MLDLLPRAEAALAGPASGDTAGLLGAVLADRETVAARAVDRLGLDGSALLAAARAAARAAERPLDRDGWARRAEHEARRRGHGYIGTEHLLLGLLNAAPVAAALAALGSSARALRGQVHRTLCDGSPGGEWQADGPGQAPGEVMAPASPHQPGGAVAPHAVAAIAGEEPVVGLSWAVSRAGQDVLTATYGWADPHCGVPVTADTRFRAGSVTKIATALLTLRLRDHGLVDLDEPATAKLRSVRLLDHDGAPSAATVRQLLTHTAGLPRGSGLRHYAGPVPPAGELFAEGIRAERPAGQWSYSNLGFVALAALAADVLGQPFGAGLTDWVLGPLGLTESASQQLLPVGALSGELLSSEALSGELAPSGAPAEVSVARGYAFDAGLVFPVRPSAVLALGAGDLVASARDVAALAAATANGQLLRPESAREMLMPYAQCGPDTWQGLGVQIEHHGLVRLVGHGGTFPGFEAAAYACPETMKSAALLANTNSGLLKAQVRDALGQGSPPVSG